MKSLVCFAVLFVVFSSAVKSAPTAGGSNDENNGVHQVAVDVMDPLEPIAQADTRRSNKRSNGLKELREAGDDAVSPDTKKKKPPPKADHDPPAKPPAKPSAQPAPKPQAKPPAPPAAQPPAAQPVPAPPAPAAPAPDPYPYYIPTDNYHHYQHPSEYHHRYEDPHHTRPHHPYEQPFGSYRETIEEDKIGSERNEYELGARQNDFDVELTNNDYEVQSYQPLSSDLYQPPSSDLYQPPTGCPKNIVVGCTPVVSLVPCCSHDSHSYGEEPAPPAYLRNDEFNNDLGSYREDQSETEAPSILGNHETAVVHAEIPSESHVKPTIPAQKTSQTPVEKFTNTTKVNLIDSDAKEVKKHADITSTTEKTSETKVMPAPSASPIKTLTVKKMEDMRKMAKKLNELTPSEPRSPEPMHPVQHQSIAAAQSADTKESTPRESTQFEMDDMSVKMPQLHQHMYGEPQMVGSMSAGGSPTQTMYYQNYQYQ